MSLLARRKSLAALKSATVYSVQENSLSQKLDQELTDLHCLEKSYVVSSELQQSPVKREQTTSNYDSADERVTSQTMTWKWLIKDRLMLCSMRWLSGAHFLQHPTDQELPSCQKVVAALSYAFAETESAHARITRCSKAFSTRSIRTQQASAAWLAEPSRFKWLPPTVFVLRRSASHASFIFDWRLHGGLHIRLNHDTTRAGCRDTFIYRLIDILPSHHDLCCTLLFVSAGTPFSTSPRRQSTPGRSVPFFFLSR